MENSPGRRYRHRFERGWGVKTRISNIQFSALGRYTWVYEVMVTEEAFNFLFWVRPPVDPPINMAQQYGTDLNFIRSMAGFDTRLRYE
jgi:hypothetical protein